MAAMGCPPHGQKFYPNSLLCKELDEETQTKLVDKFDMDLLVRNLLGLIANSMAAGDSSDGIKPLHVVSREWWQVPSEQKWRGRKPYHRRLQRQRAPREARETEQVAAEAAEMAKNKDATTGGTQ